MSHRDIIFYNKSLEVYKSFYSDIDKIHISQISVEDDYEVIDTSKEQVDFFAIDGCNPELVFVYEYFNELNDDVFYYAVYGYEWVRAAELAHNRWVWCRVYPSKSAAVRAVKMLKVVRN